MNEDIKTQVAYEVVSASVRIVSNGVVRDVPLVRTETVFEYVASPGMEYESRWKERCISYDLSPMEGRGDMSDLTINRTLLRPFEDEDPEYRGLDEADEATQLRVFLNFVLQGRAPEADGSNVWLEPRDDKLQWSAGNGTIMFLPVELDGVSYLVKAWGDDGWHIEVLGVK